MNFSTKLVTTSSSHFLTGGVKPGAPASFVPTEILYHRLQVTASPDVKFTYSYGSGSGRYVKSDGSPIADSELHAILSDLHDGSLGNLPLLYNPNIAPKITVHKSCYIVIELVSPQNMMFCPGDYAVKIDASKANYYCLLQHYDSDTVPIGNAGDLCPATPPCRFISFGAQNWVNFRDDLFSLQMLFDQGGGDTMTATIDPAIKNRGDG